MQSDDAHVPDEVDDAVEPQTGDLRRDAALWARMLGASKAECARAGTVKEPTLDDWLARGADDIKAGKRLTLNAKFAAWWSHLRLRNLIANAKAIAESTSDATRMRILDAHLRDGFASRQDHHHTHEVTFTQADQDWADRKLSEIQRALDERSDHTTH